ncbi:MAG: hypothetical protein LBE01_05265 [Deltaproteobacteria bacterium]|nr:hypothetical protein [Deltaproteobacteria bacterium]
MTDLNYARHKVVGHVAQINHRRLPQGDLYYVRVAVWPRLDWGSYEVALKGRLAQSFKDSRYRLGDRVALVLSHLEVYEPPNPNDRRPKAFRARGLKISDRRKTAIWPAEPTQAEFPKPWEREASDRQPSLKEKAPDLRRVAWPAKGEGQAGPYALSPPERSQLATVSHKTSIPGFTTNNGEPAVNFGGPILGPGSAGGVGEWAKGLREGFTSALYGHGRDDGRPGAEEDRDDDGFEDDEFFDFDEVEGFNEDDYFDEGDGFDEDEDDDDD